MPNYEYKCTQDGSTFELWQEVGAAGPPCPDCGAPSKKVFRPTRVIFKGSGFYVTDLRSETQNAAKTDKPDAKPETAGSETVASDASASETKSSETKSSETKSSETKSSETPKADKTDSPAASDA